MRMNLVIVAIEQIEALVLWHAARSDIADAPLPESARAITDLLEYLRDRHIFIEQRNSAGVESHGSSPHVLACHQHRSTRRTNRASSVRFREMKRLFGQPIEMRSLNHFRSHEPSISRAHVIDHDVNEVWFLGIGVHAYAERDKNGE